MKIEIMPQHFVANGKMKMQDQRKALLLRKNKAHVCNLGGVDFRHSI